MSSILACSRATFILLARFFVGTERTTLFLCYVSANDILSVVSERYAKNGGAVFGLKYHLVWCPSQGAHGPVDKRLKVLLNQKAEEMELTLRLLEVMPDHVHAFVEGPPTLCVAEIVNGLKGFTSRVLREEYPFLRSRLPTLWSRSYYAGSVGSVSEAVVRKYIEGQKGK